MFREGTRMFTRAVAGSGALLMVLAVCVVATPSARASTSLAAGDLLAGDNVGNVNHYSADGTFLEGIYTGATSIEMGACQDSSGNVYQTNFSTGSVIRIKPDGTVDPSFLAYGMYHPLSCAVAPNGNILVGQDQNVEALDSSGAAVAVYPVGADRGGSGSWISLDSDGCTLNVAAGEFTQYNICTNSITGSLHTIDDAASQSEQLSNGDLLVADAGDVEEINSSGVVRTYTVPGSSALTSLAISADGNSFWVGDFESGTIAKISLSTGDVLQTLQQANDVQGLLVYGQGSTSSSHVLLGIGDSVAAGHGLGLSTGFPDNRYAYPMLAAARLGYSGRDYAITGACAVSQNIDGASPLTPSTCTTSVLSDELPAAAGVKPDVITLTIGANDIRFGECLQAIMLSKGKNPCQGTTFTNDLTALSQNLGLLFTRLKTTYPGVPIYVMRYYNPLPQPPISAQEICPASRAIAAYRAQKKSAYIGALIRGLTGQSDAVAEQVQTTLYDIAQAVVKQLNKTIVDAATAAGAKTVPIYFGGHDYCRTLTGGSTVDTWVYGPSIHGTVSGFTGLISATIPFDFDLPSVCPTPDAGDSTAYYVSGSGQFGALGAWSYSFTGKVNCLPHPTLYGQHAIARAFVHMISP
jgi:lysophospholipase L1-like esterase